MIFFYYFTNMKLFAPSFLKNFLSLNFILIMLFSYNLAKAQENKFEGKIKEKKENTKTTKLEINKDIEQEITYGNKHIYQLQLTKNQYIHILIKQKGVNIKSTIFDPDKIPVLEFEGFGSNQGLEEIFLVTQKTGLYKLELSSLEEQVIGKYKIGISQLREATSQDVDYFNGFIDAYKFFLQAYQLYTDPSKDSIEKAIENYIKALSIYEKIGNIEGQANINVFLGTAYSIIGGNDQALECLNKSLPKWKQLDNPSSEANTLQLIGGIYNFIGDNQKALEYLNQALKIVNEIENTAVEAAIAFNIGKVHRDMGDNQKALEMLNRSLELDTKTGNLSSKAYTLNFIGVVYIELGDNQKALAVLFEALNLHIKLKDISGQATAYNSIGGFYLYLAKFDDALEFLNKALELHTKLGDLIGINETLSNLGATYKQIGEKEQALKYLNKALNIQVELKEIVAQAVTLNTIAGIYIEQKQYDKALTYLEKSLELNKTTGNRFQEASNLINFGIVYKAKGELEKALELSNQALEIYKSIKNPSGQSEALFRIASVNRNTNNLDQALESIKESVEIVESSRDNIKIQDLRTSYFSSAQDKYKFYIDLLMQLHRQQPLAGYDIQAFIVNENSHARSLLDLVNQSKVDIRKGLSVELIKQEEDLKKELNEKTAALLKAQLDGKELSKEEISNLEKKIKEIKKELEQIELKTKNESIIYATLNKPKPISLEEIQREILDQDTVLLEYCLGENDSYLWVVSFNHFASYRLAKRSIINKKAKDLYNSLSTMTNFGLKGKRKLLKQDYENLATELSDLLLLPAIDKLDKKRLVIVADGILNFIPFSTLAEPKTKKLPSKQYLPLIVNHTIVTEPSIATLLLLKKYKLDKIATTKTITLFGDPIFGYDDVRVRKSLFSKETKQKLEKIGHLKSQNEELSRTISKQSFVRFGDKLTRLKFTGEEIKNIISLLPYDQSEVWLGFDANLNNVTNRNLKKYQYIHFATHGLVDSENPQFTALVLSLIDKDGKEINGFLTLNEIFNLRFDAEMITLSACQTALGKEVSGEGLIGLTHAFMYAGTKRLVVSLWNINDQATAQLMVKFYKEIFNSKLTPSEALRTAQLSMMKEPKWQSPYYWAAFQLQGEW